MKHLRRFNEELNPKTYRKISSDLLKTHPNKSTDISRHATKLERDEFVKIWEKIVPKYSEYKPVKLKGFNNEFYPIYEVPPYSYFEDNYSLEIVEGFIPCNEDGVLEVYSKSLYYTKVPDTHLIDDICDILPIVHTRLFKFDIKYHDTYSEIHNVRIITKYKYEDYGLNDLNGIRIHPESARYCYQLFKSLFDENSKYPYSPFPFVDGGEVETMYDYINNIIVAPYSADTGINDVLEFRDKFLETYSNYSKFYQE